MPIAVDKDVFKELMNQEEKPVVLEFWAEWCGPCQTLDPVLRELEQQFEDQVLVGKVNVDEQPLLSALFKVRSIPTFLFFNNGRQVDQVVGLITRRGIFRLTEKLIEHSGSSA